MIVEIKEVLLRADLTLYDFQGLVKYAISLVSSLPLIAERSTKKKRGEGKTVFSIN